MLKKVSIGLQNLFSERKVLINQAIRTLKANGISVNEEEAVTILDFLYMLANSFKKIDMIDGAEGEVLR